MQVFEEELLICEQPLNLFSRDSRPNDTHLFSETGGEASPALTPPPPTRTPPSSDRLAVTGRNATIRNIDVYYKFQPLKSKKWHECHVKEESPITV